MIRNSNPVRVLTLETATYNWLKVKTGRGRYNPTWPSVYPWQKKKQIARKLTQLQSTPITKYKQHQNTIQELKTPEASQLTSKQKHIEPNSLWQHPGWKEGKNSDASTFGSVPCYRIPNLNGHKRGN
jgi:hypothetical protein